MSNNDAKYEVLSKQYLSSILDIGDIWGERLFSHTDNLSKALQKTKMSAVSGQRNVNVTKQVLQRMRNNECVKSFSDTVVTKSKKNPSILDPALPRQTRAPSSFEIGTWSPSYPTKRHHRNITDAAYTLRLLT